MAKPPLTVYDFSSASPVTADSATCVEFDQSVGIISPPVLPGSCEFKATYADTSYVNARALLGGWVGGMDVAIWSGEVLRECAQVLRLSVIGQWENEPPWLGA